MRETLFSPIRIVFGIVLMVLGFLFVPPVLNSTLSNNRLISLLSIVSLAAIIGTGAWLLFRHSFRMFLEPLSIFALWISLVFLPIWLLPLPKDALYLVLGFSPFLALLLWIGYTKLKAWYKGKRNT